MAIIYHMTKPQTWKMAKEKNVYDFCALKTDGFIHCSTLEQTLPTANRFFRDELQIIVLVIDEDKVNAKIIYEPADDVDESFPHIYGEINLDAVIKVQELEKDADDYFIGLKDQVYL